MARAVKRRINVVASIIAFVAMVTQLVLFVLLKTHTRDEFYSQVRLAFLWGIALTLVYKESIVFLMAITVRKKPLDRAFVWHTQAVGLLFVYAFITIEWPLLTQQNPILLAWIWFNIWVNVCLSAGFVMYYLWKERVSPCVTIIRKFGWPGRKAAFALLRGVRPDELEKFG